MEKEEFESGLVEYIRKGLKDYRTSIVYSTYFMEQSYLIVDYKFFKHEIGFNITDFMNKNFSFAKTMKYPNCLCMIEKDCVAIKILYEEIFSIIKKEFDKKMDKAYIEYCEKENNNQQELEIAHLQSELTKYKSLYSNAQSQLQTIKSIINKIEG